MVKVERVTVDGAEFVTSRGAAEAADIKFSTWTAYVQRDQAPTHELLLGQTRLWRLETVMRWAEGRSKAHQAGYRKRGAVRDGM